MSRNEKSDLSLVNDISSMSATHLWDLILWCPNELFFYSIQDAELTNADSSAGFKNHRKYTNMFLDKDNGMLYRGIWSISNVICEICRTRSEMLIAFKDSKINGSCTIDYTSKWIISNRIFWLWCHKNLLASRNSRFQGKPVIVCRKW